MKTKQTNNVNAAGIMASMAIGFGITIVAILGITFTLFMINHSIHTGLTPDQAVATIGTCILCIVAIIFGIKRQRHGEKK